MRMMTQRRPCLARNGPRRRLLRREEIGGAEPGAEAKVKWFQAETRRETDPSRAQFLRL